MSAPFWSGCQDLGTLGERQRFPFGDEAEEAAERGQPAVSSSDRDFSFLLAVAKERQHLLRGKVFDRKVANGPPPSGGDEAQEQPPRVPIGQHGMVGEIPLLRQPLMEERVQPIGHRCYLHGCSLTEPSATAPCTRNRSLACCINSCVTVR